MFLMRDAAQTMNSTTYLFGDDDALVVVPDNSERLADDMLI